MLLAMVGVALADDESCEKTDNSEQLQEVAATMRELFKPPTEQQKPARIESMKWTQGLWQEMLDSDDDYLQALALLEAHSHVGYAKFLATLDLPETSEKSKQIVSEAKDRHRALLQTINEMVVSNRTLKAETLSIFSGLCGSEQDCDLDLLFEKQAAVDGDNALIYLHPLTLAIKNQEQIDALLEKMANAKTATNYMYISAQLVSFTLDYAERNPISDLVLEDTKSSLQVFYKGSSLSDEQYRDIVIANTIIPSYLSLPIPSYRPLMNYCENNPQQSENCLKVFNLFINQDSDLLTQLVGYSGKIKILKAQSKEQQAAQLETKKEQIDELMQCLVKSIGSTISNGNPNFYDLVLSLEYLKQRPIDNLNELEDLKQRAIYTYQQGTKQGLHDLIDPQSCFVED